MPPTPTSSEDHITPSNDPGVSERIKLAMNRLEVTDFPFRYHGSSSQHHVYLAIDEIRGARDVEFLSHVKSSMRPRFWSHPPWDVTAPFAQNRATWPDPSLENQLVDSYFNRIDTHLPLLDELAFRAQLASGLHARDCSFAAVCWLVFANAARFVDHPDVLCYKDPCSAGAAHFLAAQALYQTKADIWTEIPDTTSLQITVLKCTWLHGTASPHLAWLLAGSQLRASQELGIHVRVSHEESSEMLAAKRAFWCLYHLDMLHCVSSGRRPVLREGEFDYDLPLVFQADARTSAFAQKLVLDRIIGQTLDKLYGVHAGTTEDVKKLLAMTDAWKFALPSFLQVAPGPPITHTADSLSLHNASLAIHFHYVRILINRPLLPRTSRATDNSEQALDRVLEDSCAISDIVDRLSEMDCCLSSDLMYPIWCTFGILQLAVVYAFETEGSRHLQSTRWIRHMDSCNTALGRIERRWRYAGKLADWTSETMRSLAKRYRAAFTPDMLEKWTVTATGSTVWNTGDVAGLEVPSDVLDYDQIFAELFGRAP